MAFTKKQMEQILLDDLGANIRGLQIEAVKNFVVRSIETYGDTNKLIEANHILDLLLRMFEKRHIYVNQQTATFYELMKAAVLIHNLFYNGTLASLFEAREKLTPIALECGLPTHDAINPIFETVEAQLGADTPVPRCAPAIGQPQELFAEACWFVSELHGGKKMPYFAAPAMSKVDAEPVEPQPTEPNTQPAVKPEADPEAKSEA